MLILFLLLALVGLLFYLWPSTPKAEVESRIEIKSKFLPTLGGQIPQSVYNRALDKSPDLTRALKGMTPSENQHMFNVEITTDIRFDGEDFPSSSSSFVLLVEVLLNAEAAN